MRILYGSPLPPGVDAPTRGELRIRVEKLLLKDNLVHLNIMSETYSADLRQYVIPVDHCAVSPLFWGEQHPTCHCVPPTPKKPRGAVSLVYPLKTYEPQFNEYLNHMSNSAHRGVQISVFIPTSYSGRHKRIPVGKSIVALDALGPSSPISGWFTIMSDEVSIAGAPEGSENVVSGVFLEVGKLKLTFTLTFFTRMPLSPSSRPNRTSSAASRGRSVEKEAGIDREKVQSRSPSKQESLFAQSLSVVVPEVGTTFVQQQQHQVDRSSVTGSKQVPYALQEAVNLPLTSVPIQTNLPSTTSVMPAVLSRESNQRTAINELLQKGFSLREKMAKALSPSDDFEDVTSFSNFLSTRPITNSLQATPSYVPPPSSAEHLHDSLPISLDLPKSSMEDSLSSVSVESVTSNGNDSVVLNSATKEELETRCDVSGEKRPLKITPQPSEGPLRENSYVEVDLSHISFSSGRATLGMEEMRVGIRLSKEVKTDEPVESYSSYVHRVPLVRGAEHHIVIGFLLRSFSEDKSRMVISFYRVRSAPVANPPGEKLLPVPATAQRVLIEETLLGMCIVGLHSQSRNIVLHDPVSGEDPTQAHLRVSIQSGPKLCVENGRVNGSLEKETQMNQSLTPVERDEKGTVTRGSSEWIALTKTLRDAKNSKSDKEPSRKGRDNVRSQSSSSVATSSSSSSPLLSSLDRLPTRRKDGGEDGTSAGQVSAHDRPSQPSVVVAATQDPVVVGSSPSKSKHQVTHIVPCDPSTTAELVHVRRGGGDGSIPLMNVPAMTISGVDEKMASALSTRFRIHVAIRAGKELPMVTLNRSGPPLMSFVAATDHLESGVRSAVTIDGRLVLVDSEHRVFQPPSTFFVIEDVFSGVDSRAASKGAVPDWFVEAAVRGEYDRTWIVPESQSPQYNYECILSLPREAVYLRHAIESSCVPTNNKSSLIVADDSSFRSLVASLCLQELRLTLWHAAHDTNDGPSCERMNKEEEFWAKTAVLGECRVDLRSLRFLKVLDGWYRIYAVDKVDEVVGYVRVGVRLL